jgi:hypothetical protein
MRWPSEDVRDVMQDLVSPLSESCKSIFYRLWDLIVSIYWVPGAFCVNRSRQVFVVDEIVFVTTSIDLIEEVDELLKIYFVVWFRSGNLYHCCKHTNRRLVRTGWEAPLSWKSLGWGKSGTYSESLRRTLSRPKAKRRTLDPVRLCTPSYSETERCQLSQAVDF